MAQHNSLEDVKSAAKQTQPIPLTPPTSEHRPWWVPDKPGSWGNFTNSSRGASSHLHGLGGTAGLLPSYIAASTSPKPFEASDKVAKATMLASGFTNAPISQLLLLGIVSSAIVASLTDTKYFLWIEVRPHLLDYWQYWRLLTWQLAYTNSAEVLFAAMTFYQLRVIERLWGSRKFASFLVSTYIYTALLPPILLAVIIRPLSWGRINYLPSGPTPLLFALLAQYHAAIPYIYKYRLSSSLPTSTTSAQEYGILLTSKATSYLLPLQLALSQLPGSAIAAGVGWIIGFAYRREILPGTTRWRLPTWIVGGGEQKERYDSLRRRMEGEAGRATGVQADGAAQGQTRRRGMLGGLADQFRGAA